jgi:DNA-binding MarR family transcriptional regulator
MFNRRLLSQDAASIGSAMEPSASTGSLVLLTRLSRVIHRRASESLLGMTMKEFAVLNALRDNDAAILQQDLGRLMVLDANMLVLMLNALEAAGHVERRRDPADRRRHIVAITESGLRAVEHAEQALDGIEDEVLKALSPQERATLHGLLTKTLEPHADEVPGREAARAGA